MAESSLEKELKGSIDRQALPRHTAIIMDGNGRWAEKRGFPRIEGHRRGVEAVREIVRASSQLGIEWLTLYAFSEENWSRPRPEVRALMKLLNLYLIRERKELQKNNVRFTMIGNLEKLPPMVQRTLQETVEATAQNSGMVLILALSYSGRDEIVRAIRTMARKCQEAELTPEEITPESFSAFLDTSQIPDPDLLVRTSGELRISNFLLWQLAYTEIYVTPTLWPDFSRKDLYEAVLDYQGRERRFGLTQAQVETQAETLEKQCAKN